MNGYAIQESFELETGIRVQHPRSDASLRLLTWNLRGPSLARARVQASWLAERDDDVLILTELRCNEALEFYGALLERRGYHVRFTRTTDRDYVVCVAIRAVWLESVDLEMTYASHRAQAAAFESAVGQLTLVGLYVPSRGPAHSRNVAKRSFQNEIARRLSALAEVRSGSLIVGGDLNVLERGHIPHYSVFGEWEYDFYDAFSRSGLVDAFRVVQPNTTAHSWFGRGGNGYRFDHFFVSRDLVRWIQCCDYLGEPLVNGLSDHAAMQLVLRDSVQDLAREP